VDATRCIAYLTIERRGPIDPSLERGIGEWLFGCDVCQDVCPHNSPRAGPDVRAEYAERRAGFDLLGVLGWDEAGRRREFESSALKRATLAMMKRNALIVLGNLMEGGRGTEPMRARVAAAAVDEGEPEMVREAARRALTRGGFR
jgi:epoxyqueuosine reductase QueG